MTVKLGDTVWVWTNDGSGVEAALVTKVYDDATVSVKVIPERGPTHEVIACSMGSGPNCWQPRS